MANRVAFAATGIKSRGRLRLASGLIMFAYLFLHFVNQAWAASPRRGRKAAPCPGIHPARSGRPRSRSTAPSRCTSRVLLGDLHPPRSADGMEQADQIRLPGSTRTRRLDRNAAVGAKASSSTELTDVGSPPVCGPSLCRSGIFVTDMI